MHYLLEKITLLKLTLWQFTNQRETNQPTVSSQTRHGHLVYSGTDFWNYMASEKSFVVIAYFFFHRMRLFWAWNKLCKLHVWYEDPYDYLFVLLLGKKILLSVKNCESSELIITLICIKIQLLYSLLFSLLTTTFISC